MKRKTTKKKAAPKVRNPHARALKESGLFKPKVVPATKDETYRRRGKHPTPIDPDDET